MVRLWRGRAFAHALLVTRLCPCPFAHALLVARLWLRAFAHALLVVRLQASPKAHHQKRTTKGAHQIASVRSMIQTVGSKA